MVAWRLGDLRNRLGEVVRRALGHRAQWVTRDRREAAAVASAKDRERLGAPADLVDFVRRSPLAEVLAEGELDLDRLRHSGRDVAL